MNWLTTRTRADGCIDRKSRRPRQPPERPTMTTSNADVVWRNSTRCARRPSTPGGARSKQRRTTLSWRQLGNCPGRKRKESSARVRNARSVAPGSAPSSRPVGTTGSASSVAMPAAARRSAAFGDERGCVAAWNPSTTNQPSHSLSAPGAPAMRSRSRLPSPQTDRPPGSGGPVWRAMWSAGERYPSMVCGFRWSTVALGLPTLDRNTTNPLAELGLWTPSEA